ncbi:LAFA_0D05116g1_1 [Lachancea sp. 'fantastica']|nr:LAFA_0D05116g1_1 [Lachancea sp. 'fantastica']
MPHSDAESSEENLEGSAESGYSAASDLRPEKRRRLNNAGNRVRYEDEDDNDDDNEDNDDDNSDDPYYGDLYETLQQDPIDVDATQSGSYNPSAAIANPGPNVIPSTQVEIDPGLVPSYFDADVIDISGHEDVSDTESKQEKDFSRDASTEIGTTPQTALEILDDEPAPRERHDHRRARDYKCPICFESPEVALYTPCGHIFCIECIFEMINSVKANRKVGQCALCRRDVSLGKIKLLKLRKKRIPKDS